MNNKQENQQQGLCFFLWWKGETCKNLLALLPLLVSYTNNEHIAA